MGGLPRSIFLAAPVIGGGAVRPDLAVPPTGENEGGGGITLSDWPPDPTRSW